MKNNKELTGIVVSAICVIIVLINRIVSFVNYFIGSKYDSAVLCLFSIVMALMTLWYCILQYNKPHGNELRLLFICFALYIAHHSSIDLAYKAYLLSGYSLLLASLIISYISGRLNKLQKNKALLIIVAILLLSDALIHAYKDVFSLTRIISLLVPLVLYVSICFAYISRYKEHIEAGLND